MRRPRRKGQHLLADKGYFGAPVEAVMKKYRYIPEVIPRYAEIKAKRDNPQQQARRWVVERTHSWLNRYRKLLVRYEKKTESYLGLLQLACALITWRNVIIIYG